MELFDSEDPETIYQSGVKAGSLIYTMVTGMFQHYTLENFRKPMALFQYIDLINYLNIHGNAQTSVSDLAALKMLSRENFTRHLIADTGITPKQLIDRFVINRCLTLIGQGYSFKEISRIMKFPDAFAFSRYFKRNIGESPRAWKQSRNENFNPVP
jgi:transcriptional regulator GlxA family with amidase domain